jgi:hypothetical protein
MYRSNVPPVFTRSTSSQQQQCIQDWGWAKKLWKAAGQTVNNVPGYKLKMYPGTNKNVLSEKNFGKPHTN